MMSCGAVLAVLAVCGGTAMCQTTKPVSSPASAPATAPAGGMGKIVGRIVDANGQPGALPEKTLTLELGDGVRMQLALIPAGRFTMSRQGRDGNEVSQRVATIGRPFYMGIHEVTYAQFKAVMGGLGERRTKDPNLPISSVSHEHAQDFCRRLSERTGRSVSLPTEEQWEYACRAGSRTAYCFGDDERRLPEYARFGQRGNAGPLPVGHLKPNAWGLHDMHGNLAEWCDNCAVRGGGWAMGPAYVRSSSRSPIGSTRAMSVDVGFRVVTTSDPPTVPTSAPAGGTGKIVGKVVDPNGEPVEGANVSVCILEGGVPSANMQVLGKTKSGKDGTFNIDGITPGEKRTLWVRRPSPGRGILTADVNDLKIGAGKTLDLGAVKVSVLRLLPQVRGGPEPLGPPTDN